MGVHEGKNGRDTATASELAEYIGLDEQEVRTVLDGFNGILRRSGKQYETREQGLQYRYTLQLRYARLKYVDGHIAERGDPLSNDDLFGLLGFVTNRVEQEQENERHATSSRITILGVWIAGTASIMAAIVGTVGLLLR